MIERHGHLGRAVFSDDLRHRYLLTREFGGDGPRLGIVMLNPSTADENASDPTIRRCEVRARSIGARELVIMNLFAYRATRPDDLFGADDPVGPDNDDAYTGALPGSALILCAWGGDRRAVERAGTVVTHLRRLGPTLCHIGLCKSGAPRHPLYTAGTRPIEPWPV